MQRQSIHSLPPAHQGLTIPWVKTLFGKTKASGFVAEEDEMRNGNEVENAFDPIRPAVPAGSSQCTQPNSWCRETNSAPFICYITQQKCISMYLMWLQSPCVPFGKKTRRKGKKLFCIKNPHLIIILLQSLPLVGSLSSARKKKINLVALKYVSKGLFLLSWEF